MTDSKKPTFFRDLTDEEKAEFREWARENYTPGDPVNNLWHPVVIEECQKINQESNSKTD